MRLMIILLVASTQAKHLNENDSQVWMNLMTTSSPTPGSTDFSLNFGFFDQFLTDNDDEESGDEGTENSEKGLSTDVIGMLNAKSPTNFPKAHVMSEIFAPIKDDIKPLEL